jgi:hypothetical protein
MVLHGVEFSCLFCIGLHGSTLCFTVLHDVARCCVAGLSTCVQLLPESCPACLHITDTQDIYIIYSDNPTRIFPPICFMNGFPLSPLLGVRKLHEFGFQVHEVHELADTEAKHEPEHEHEHEGEREPKSVRA